MNEIKCTKCQSGNFRTKGTNNQGKQLYRCLDCGRQFVIRKEKEKIFCEGIKCEKCNAEKTKKSGYGSKGKPRYHCTECNYFFVTDKTKPFDNPDKIKCKKCNSTNIGKAGGNKYERKYICKECKCSFGIGEKYYSEADTQDYQDITNVSIDTHTAKSEPQHCHIEETKQLFNDFYVKIDYIPSFETVKELLHWRKSKILQAV
jgi:transposase-like protein